MSWRISRIFCDSPTICSRLKIVSGARTQRGIFAQQPVAFGATGDGVEQFLRRERLGEIINRAGLDGFNRELGRGIGREHEGGQVRPAAVEFFLEIRSRSCRRAARR